MLKLTKTTFYVAKFLFLRNIYVSQYAIILSKLIMSLAFKVPYTATALYVLILASPCIKNLKK